MIGFAGFSHLGIHYSLATAAKNFDVLAYEPNLSRCEELKYGKFPVEEPGLFELFQANRARMHFETDVKKLGTCELVFVALDIKTDDENKSDLKPLQKLIDEIAPHLAEGSTIVILSQVTPGFTRQLVKKLCQRKDFKAAHIYYQVETLIFGRAVERALYPERYIVGCENPAEPFPALFDQWHKSFGCPVLPMRYESAELAKIAINFFLVSSVSTTNTLAEVCEKIGAEWTEIASALRLDARIGQKAYLSPGLGIAGGNLERDLITVKGLSAKYQTDTGIVDAWIKNSRYRRDWVMRVLRAELKKNKPVCAVWGLAYKAHTHSIKNSPSLAFIKSAKDFKIRAYDPQVVLSSKEWPRVAQFQSELETCKGADALLVLTPWPQFEKIDLQEVRRNMKGKLILDPYGILDAAKCCQMDFRYLKLGSPIQK